MCVLYANALRVVAANAYELNNLDNAALDAPIFAHSPLPAGAIGQRTATDFTSLPCDGALPLGTVSANGGGGGGGGVGNGFGPRQPMYQSAMGRQAAAASDTVDGGGATAIAHILGEYRCWFGNL